MTEHSRTEPRQQPDRPETHDDEALYERGEQLMPRISELRVQGHIQEHPFRSGTPVIGYLIVVVRRLWNSVAAKWYIRPMLHQQNVFNQALVDVVHNLLQAHIHLSWQLSHRLEELDQRVVGGDRDVTLLARKVAEGEYRLRRWNQQAAQERSELAERISRLEALLATEDSVSRASPAERGTGRGVEGDQG
jgi:hypothetical protein